MANPAGVLTGYGRYQRKDGTWRWWCYYVHNNFDIASVYGAVGTELADYVPDDQLAVLDGMTVKVSAAAANLDLQDIYGPIMKGEDGVTNQVYLDTCVCATKEYVHVVDVEELAFPWPRSTTQYLYAITLAAYGAADDLLVSMWGHSEWRQPFAITQADAFNVPQPVEIVKPRFWPWDR